MSEFELEIKKHKSCFGGHETAVCAWHCIACVVAKECRECGAQKAGDKNEQQAN